MRTKLTTAGLALVVFSLAMLGACTPAAAPGGSGSDEGTVLVMGRATAGPTCPVERNPPDPNCAERPVAGAVMVIQDGAGREVARATTDADGRFSIRLQPASYQLVPQPVSGLMGTARPVAFRVEAGKTPAPLQVSYDTGIR
jgi:hypothetical protein